ncbi:hypothetical protein GGR54DRAFT_299623 [Hypoxylon sp. NC1633]|nr:hypothetical protein GGR54DRAFT_299623 [Hypoxylon sp. NC1633]
MDAGGLAIAVGSSVLKLVAFSIDFVGDVRQVYQNGATARNLDLAKVSNSIQTATKSLLSDLDNLSQDGDSSNADPAEKQEIKALVLRAADIGNELTLSLEKARNDPKLKWGSIRTTLRGMWDADKIEDTEKRLNGIRDEIHFRMLIDIRRTVQFSHGNEHRLMLSALETVAGSLAESKEDSRSVMEMLDMINDSIRSLRLAVSAHPASGTPITGLGGSKHPSEMEKRATREKAESVVLNSLWYASINDREEGIEEAYSETLSWIFQDPKAGGMDRDWDSFVDFLQGKPRKYWITGKPGSGKSTLMKFLSRHPQTDKLLEKWTGDRELLGASFYFFYNGSKEQKSELGFLRSLLYSILSQRSSLIPLAFQERYKAALEKLEELQETKQYLRQAPFASRRFPEPTVIETRTALARLLQGSPHLCFFLMIDGLDEFDPEVSRTNVASLIGITNILSNYENVKVVVSSRPLPEFEEAFAKCPLLRIHNLTSNDIEHYATERLENHLQMQSLLRKDPANARQLIHSITSMSSGVFLWVRLVVDSLLRGLTNCDSIRDLQERLEGLPSDLQDLYRVMLTRVEPTYRSQTCKLLQLVDHGTLNGMSLSALGLWFADQADHDMVFRTEIKPIDDEELNDRVKEMESRATSRCLGLVELQRVRFARKVRSARYRRDVYDLSILSSRLQVDFIHRTVREFLKGDTWKQFLTSFGIQYFNPSLSLLLSAILVIKTLRPTPNDSSVILGSLGHYAGIRAKGLEDTTSRSDASLLHELDRTMARHCSKLSDASTEVPNAPSPHWSIHIGNRHEQGNFRSIESGDSPEDQHPTFISFAIRFGLLQYVKEQIEICGPNIFVKQGFPLLGHALCPMLGWMESRQNIIELLLKRKCDPQESYMGVSVWGWFWRDLARSWFDSFHRPLWQKCPLSVSTWPGRGPFCIIRIMVIAGAEPNVIIPWMIQGEDRTAEWDYCTPLVVLARMHKVFSERHWTREELYGRDQYELLADLDSLIKLFQERGGIWRERYIDSKEDTANFKVEQKRISWEGKLLERLRLIKRGLSSKKPW